MQCNPTVSRIRWTYDETEFLIKFVGKKPIEWIAKKLDRTVNSIVCKANDLSIRASNNSYSLHNIMKTTGYTFEQLKEAKEATGQIWERMEADKSKNNRFKITAEQKEELLQYLSRRKLKKKYRTKLQEEWETQLHIKRCLQCGETARKHKAMGLCTQCWHRLVRNKRKYLQHKLLIKYWRIIKKYDIKDCNIHPIKQLDQWTDFLHIPLWELNIGVIYG